MGVLHETFKGVIFDLDGLLIDSEQIALRAFSSACEAAGLDLPQSVFESCVGTNHKRSRRILQDAIKSKSKYEAFAKAWDRDYQILTGQGVPLKPGARALLEYLKAHNIPIAVATSSPQHGAKKKLTQSGIWGYFHAVVSGDEVRESKPDPEIYELAASRIEVAPEDCLALEDSRNGVISALGAHMTVIQIPDLIRPDEALLKMGPIVLNSLDEVSSFEF